MDIQKEKGNKKVNNEKQINLERMYLEKTIALNDAIALWMHSGEPAPNWLIEAYERALIEYQNGGDFMQAMGLNYYEKSYGTSDKRKKHSNETKIKANIKHVLDDLSDIGKLSEPKLTPKGLGKTPKTKLLGLGKLTETERQKLYGVGLPKVIPQGGTKMLPIQAIKVLVDYLKMHHVKVIPKKEYLENLTAYQAVSLIFYGTINSESKIRRLTKKLN